jgi:uncharacterized ParB-like nuclease family protein
MLSELFREPLEPIEEIWHIRFGATIAAGLTGCHRYHVTLRIGRVAERNAPSKDAPTRANLQVPLAKSFRISISRAPDHANIPPFIGNA